MFIVPFYDLSLGERRKNGQNYADARNSGAEIYEGYCNTHGWHNFTTKNKKCMGCGIRPGKKYSTEPRAVARRAGFQQYIAECAWHGKTEFNTHWGKCLKCFDTTGQPRVILHTPNPRAEARKEGLQKYKATCPFHGETEFHTPRGKCLTCFDTLGRPRTSETDRRVKNTPRATARRAGLQSYAAECPVHREFPHSVTFGKCLTCFDSTGKPRAVTTASNPRAAARKAGEAKYIGPCEAHGATEFRTATGKCLTCYTSAGRLRINEVEKLLAQFERGPRLEARKAGKSTYVWQCGIHGRAYHDTIRGKCLECFTRTGTPRKPRPTYLLPGL